MGTLEAIVRYFSSDLMRVLYVLGGAGGIWFWLEKWWDRIRLRVRPLSHAFDPRDGLLSVTFEFEVVNLGKSPTSLEPVVICTGYDIHRKRQTSQLTVTNEDRLLPPHATKRFTALGKIDPTYPFWLFKTYRVCPTRGADRVIRTRSSPDNPLSWWRYDLELTLYLRLAWLPFIRLQRFDD
jgi:hypothetical protein